MTSRLKIFQFAYSPFCVAIVQAVRAAGIEPELVHVSNADRSEIIRLTGGAYYQVLVLVDGDWFSWLRSARDRVAVALGSVCESCSRSLNPLHLVKNNLHFLVVRSRRPPGKIAIAPLIGFAYSIK